MSARGKARRGGPPTSFAAAMRVRVTPIQHSIMTLLRGVYPRALGSLEITRIVKKLEARSHEYEWSITPRMCDLVELGLAEEAGVRTIINSNGNAAPMKTWRARFPFVEMYVVGRPSRPSNLPPEGAMAELLQEFRREAVVALIAAIDQAAPEDVRSAIIAVALYDAIGRGDIPHVRIEALAPRLSRQA